MLRRTRDRLKLLRSKVFGVPSITGVRSDASNVFRVGKNEIGEANEAWKKMGLGTPFEADGKPRLNRNQKKKAREAINERRADQGQPPLVNFDGGYGD